MSKPISATATTSSSPETSSSDVKITIYPKQNENLYFFAELLCKTIARLNPQDIRARFSIITDTKKSIVEHLIIDFNDLVGKSLYLKKIKQTQEQWKERSLLSRLLAYIVNRPENTLLIVTTPLFDSSKNSPEANAAALLKPLITMEYSTPNGQVFNFGPFSPTCLGFVNSMTKETLSASALVSALKTGSNN